MIRITEWVRKRQSDAALTSVSDAGHTDGAAGSFSWFRVDWWSKSAGRWQSQRGLSLQLSAGGVSTSTATTWQGRAVGVAVCRLEAGHGAATAAEATRQSLRAFSRITSTYWRRVPRPGRSRVPPIHPSTSSIHACVLTTHACQSIKPHANRAVAKILVVIYRPSSIIYEVNCFYQNGWLFCGFLK